MSSGFAALGGRGRLWLPNLSAPFSLACRFPEGDTIVLDYTSASGAANPLFVVLGDSGSLLGAFGLNDSPWSSRRSDLLWISWRETTEASLWMQDRPTPYKFYEFSISRTHQPSTTNR